MAEVAIAKLAQEKAENADVKAFAAKLEKDHAAANTDLKEMASRRNHAGRDAKGHGPVHAKLEKLSGAAFDKALRGGDGRRPPEGCQGVREGGRTASGDSDVKAFAAKTLPTLKDHLQQVQELSKTIGAKKPTS